MLLEMCLLLSTWLAVLPLRRITAVSSHCVKQLLPTARLFTLLFFIHLLRFLLLPCKSFCEFMIAESLSRGSELANSFPTQLNSSLIWENVRLQQKPKSQHLGEQQCHCAVRSGHMAVKSSQGFVAAWRRAVVINHAILCGFFSAHMLGLALCFKVHSRDILFLCKGLRYTGVS